MLFGGQPLYNELAPKKPFSLGDVPAQLLLMSKAAKRSAPAEHQPEEIKSSFLPNQDLWFRNKKQESERKYAEIQNRLYQGEVNETGFIEKEQAKGYNGLIGELQKNSLYENMINRTSAVFEENKKAFGEDVNALKGSENDPALYDNNGIILPKIKLTGNVKIDKDAKKSYEFGLYTLSDELKDKSLIGALDENGNPNIYQKGDYSYQGSFAKKKMDYLNAAAGHTFEGQTKSPSLIKIAEGINAIYSENTKNNFNQVKAVKNQIWDDLTTNEKKDITKNMFSEMERFNNYIPDKSNQSVDVSFFDVDKNNKLTNINQYVVVKKMFDGGGVESLNSVDKETLLDMGKNYVMKNVLNTEPLMLSKIIDSRISKVTTPSEMNGYGNDYIPTNIVQIKGTPSMYNKDFGAIDVNVISISRGDKGEGTVESDDGTGINKYIMTTKSLTSDDDYTNEMNKKYGLISNPTTATAYNFNNQTGGNVRLISGESVDLRGMNYKVGEFLPTTILDRKHHIDSKTKKETADLELDADGNPIAEPRQLVRILIKKSDADKIPVYQEKTEDIYKPGGKSDYEQVRVNQSYKDGNNMYNTKFRNKKTGKLLTVLEFQSIPFSEKIGTKKSMSLTALKNVEDRKLHGYQGEYDDENDKEFGTFYPDEGLIRDTDNWDVMEVTMPYNAGLNQFPTQREFDNNSSKVIKGLIKNTGVNADGDAKANATIQKLNSRIK